MKNNWKEKELLKGINNREGAAIKELHDRIMPPLRLFVFNLVKNKADAEDLTAEAFAKFWKTAPPFQTLDHANNYLYVTAKRLSINHLKSAGHKKRGPMPEELPALTDDIESEKNSALLIQKLYEYIEKLSPKKKRVIDLWLEGKTTAAIAQAVQKSEQYVLNTRSKAIKWLQQFFVPPKH